MKALLDRARTGEAVAWAVLTCLGGAVFATSFGYGVLKDGGLIGPGFLPMLAGGLLSVLSLILFLQVVRRTGQDETASAAPGGAADGDGGDHDDGTDIFGRTEQQRVRMLWTVFALTLGALLLVPATGFLGAFGLLVLVISTVIEQRPVVPALAITGISVAVIYVIFVLFLNVPLPAGPLGLGAQ